MTAWSTQLENLRPDDVDRPFKLVSDTEDGRSNELDAFVVVTDDAVDGSLPFPDAPNKFLTGFSNICTHMGCRLAKEGVALARDPTKALILGPCPCHGTTFNLSQGGVVVLGPASQHLPQLTLAISEQSGTVSGIFPTGGQEPLEEQWPISGRS